MTDLPPRVPNTSTRARNEPPPSLTSPRTIALVGLMGVGKTTVGRRLATALSLPFKDADEEIEKAAGQSVSDIFSSLGETAFRDGEHRVIARLLSDPPHILATGGGALTHAETRRVLKDKAITVWLKADLPVLAKRVSIRNTRPLLRGRDPLEVLTQQAQSRYPLYAMADLTVETGDNSHAKAVAALLKALRPYLIRT
ncbi:MAG: shikimate kinase [Asticcacaulis sp.]